MFVRYFCCLESVIGLRCFSVTSVHAQSAKHRFAMYPQALPNVRKSAGMNQTKALRASRGPEGRGEAVGDSCKASTAARKGTSHQGQQPPHVPAENLQWRNSRRECSSQARLRGSDDSKNSPCSPPPTPSPTEEKRRCSTPMNKLMQSSEHSKSPTTMGAGRSAVDGRAQSRGKNHQASGQVDKQDTLAAPTIDLCPSKGLSEGSELEIHTPWLQCESAAFSDSIAESSTMDCSCSLPLSIASSSQQMSHGKHWPPVPPSTPHPSTPSTHSRPTSGSMSRTCSTASHTTSRSSVSNASSSKLQQQRGDCLLYTSPSPRD